MSPFGSGSRAPMAGSFPKVGLEGRGINQLPTHHFHHVMLGGWGWAKATLWETGPQSRLKSCTGRLPMDQAFPLGGVSLAGGLPKSTPPWILGMRDRLWEMGHCLIWFPQRVSGQGQEAGQGSGREGTSSSPPRVKEVGGHRFMQQLLPLLAGLFQRPSPRLCPPWQAQREHR